MNQILTAIAVLAGVWVLVLWVAARLDERRDERRFYPR